MEHDEWNVKLLCSGCHIFWWHKSPIEAWEWLRETLPKERLGYLKQRANSIDKTRYDFKKKKAELEARIEELN